MKNMFPARYGDLHGESSIRRSHDHQQQHQNQQVNQDDTQAAAYDDAFDSSIFTLRNLTLSHPSEEISRPNRRRFAAYLPHTLDDSSTSETRNNRWMGQIYPPNVISHGFSSSIGFQSPNNSLPGLGGYTSQHQFPISRAPGENIQVSSVEMLTHVLDNPYIYMTSSTTYQLLENLLAGSETFNIVFRDCLLEAILKSKDFLLCAICTYQGSSVIQKLIKLAKHRPLMVLLPRALADHTVLLMTNQSGMHVVRKCFIELDADKYLPLFNNFMKNNNWLRMAKDKNGCRGLNECLDYMLDTYKDLLLRSIANFAPELALDPYGTYVVQHVIDLRTIHTEQIVTSLISFYEVLCTIKNGSHLVEKCLKTPYTSIVVTELIRSGKVLKFAYHEFGNYVIQKAILYTKGNDNNSLRQKLMRQLNVDKNGLQNNRYGKNVAKLLTDQ